MQSRGWDRDDQRIGSSSRHEGSSTTSLNRRERRRNDILEGEKVEKRTDSCRYINGLRNASGTL